MTTTQAIRIHRTGGPDQLVVETIPLAEPGPGEVRLRQHAVGLNFIDTYHRSGLYPLPALPAVLGREAAGTVEALGEGVDGLAVGDRVAYALEAGAYCGRRNIAAERLVALPETVSFETAAAVMLKGLTAHYLVRRTHRVAAGETILVHAAAGGVGLLLCQWAAHLGATVIGTVGSPEKAALAAAHGCHHAVIYTRENFVERVHEITGGEGVPVVYDSVGRDTFEPSLDCLRPLGLMVSFGQSSGAIPPIHLGILAGKGSLYVTRPTLATHIAGRRALEEAAADLLDLVGRGVLRVETGQRYPLAEAARAHRDLEGRKTLGSSILLPWTG